MRVPRDFLARSRRAYFVDTRRTIRPTVIDYPTGHFVAGALPFFA